MLRQRMRVEGEARERQGNYTQTPSEDEKLQQMDSERERRHQETLQIMDMKANLRHASKNK